jgi:iron-sulfur cluster repair protein YtfE (RIC family)
MPYKNDMSMMLAIHDALRRELDCLTRVTARADGNPRQVLRTAAGWEMFKSYLHAHHTAEDRMLWPPLRLSLPEGSDGWAVLDALEAEHAEIDPLLERIDGAVLDPDSDPARLADLTDRLASAMRGHLDHEEKDGLPVIDGVSAEQWQAFAAEGAKLIGGDVARFLPWTLDDVPPETTAAVLRVLPPPVQQLYREQWEPAYSIQVKATRWG